MNAPAQTDDRLIRDFASIDAAMLAAVGGKAANLGVLTAAGLPVPPGFCVTTEAYRLVAERAGVEALLTGDVSAARVRAALLAAPMPDEVRDAVLAEYAKLGEDVPVAVRSS